MKMLKKMRWKLDENDDFDFNQDNSIEYDEEYRSPGWDRYKKKNCLNGKNKKKIKTDF